MFDTIFPPERYYRMEDYSYCGNDYFVNSSRIKSVDEYRIYFDIEIDPVFHTNYLPSDHFEVWNGPDFPKEETAVGTIYSLPYYMRNFLPEKWKDAVEKRRQ